MAECLGDRYKLLPPFRLSTSWEIKKKKKIQKWNKGSNSPVRLHIRKHVVVGKHSSISSGHLDATVKRFDARVVVAFQDPECTLSWGRHLSIFEFVCVAFPPSKGNRKSRHEGRGIWEPWVEILTIPPYSQLGGDLFFFFPTLPNNFPSAERWEPVSRLRTLAIRGPVMDKGDV